MQEMFTLPKGTEITKEILNQIIDYAECRNRRFKKLEDYYNGKHCILDRIKQSTNINNKVITNHAKAIVDTTTGYFMGKPVDYVPSQEYENKIDPILDSYNEQGIDSLDADISENVSIMGCQYEYVYSNENAEPRSCMVDNKHTIIVYDDSVEHNKMFALMYRPIYNIAKSNRVDHYEIIYVDNKVIRKYECSDKYINVIGEEMPHTFGKVPMIEYTNNSRKHGDFECVIELIDAYNLLMSDRVNDKEQLVDAILCFYGVDLTPEQARMLKESRMLASVPEGARAEYLIKSLQESEIDVLRKNIENDIYKISQTPNMTDESFAQNSSGVALKYKLMPFEQRIGKTERSFSKGLRERFELYNNFLVSKSMMGAVPVKEISIIFTRNMPSNDYETSQMINNLADMLPKETLLGQLSFVQDASEEVELLNKEKEENIKMFGMPFQNDYADSNEQDNIEENV